MNIRCLPGLAVFALAVLAASAGSASAAPMQKPSNPMLLFDTPTADVLPVGSIAVSADITLPLTYTSKNYGHWEADANARFSPVKRLDFAVTAYTFADYVLDVKYQVIGGEPGRLGLAVGVSDVGFNNYVSPVGHGLDDAWPDWKYSKRTLENFSAFAVTSIPVSDFARVHVGLGRGRFVGYANHSKYLNTDIFFKRYHQWALAMFGGVEVYVSPHVALIAEASSRDLNTGIRASIGPVTATAAWKKMEGLLWEKGDDRFGRLEFGVSYQWDDLLRHREPLPRPAPTPTPTTTPTPTPTPTPAPESVVVEPVRPELLPIHFGFDQSDIRPGDAGILQSNYDVLRQSPPARLIIEGYCDPIGTSEYNLALGMRRAEAAKAYLVKLGTDPNTLSTISFGEEKLVTQDVKQFELNRRCEFERRD